MSHTSNPKFHKESDVADSNWKVTQRYVISVFILLLLFIYVISMKSTCLRLISSASKYATFKSLELDVPSTAILRCVRPVGDRSTEGLGSLIARNQLVFFLAHVFGSKVAWDHIHSGHSYEVNRLFSDCNNASESCIIDPNQMIINRCPRGDCSCLWKSVRKYVLPKAESCSVLGIQYDGFRTLEYCGCIRKPLQRYFVHSRTPKFKYNAIHYRLGDLSGDSLKSYSSHEMFSILSTMCILNDYPIVVLTEGMPNLPNVSCFDRIIMAASLTLEDTFTIMSYAKVISVGESTFAYTLASVTYPERVIVLQRSVLRYTWMNPKDWTVIGRHGVVLHFDNKELMLENAATANKTRVLSTRDHLPTFQLNKSNVRYRPENFWEKY